MRPVKRIKIDPKSVPHPRWVPNSVPIEDGYELDDRTVLAYWRFKGGGGRWDTVDAELLRYEVVEGSEPRTRKIGGVLMMYTHSPEPPIAHEAFVIPGTSEPVVGAVKLGRWEVRALMGDEQAGYRLLS